MGGASWFPRLRRFLRPAGGAKADRRCTVAGGAHRSPRGSWWRLLVDEEREKKITFKVWRANGSDRSRGWGGARAAWAEMPTRSSAAGPDRLMGNLKPLSEPRVRVESISRAAEPRARASAEPCA